MYHRELGERVAARGRRPPGAAAPGRDRRRPGASVTPPGRARLRGSDRRPRAGAAGRAHRRRPPPLVHGRHHRPAEGRDLGAGHPARLRAGLREHAARPRAAHHPRRGRCGGTPLPRPGQPARDARSRRRSCTRPRPTSSTPRCRSGGSGRAAPADRVDGDAMCRGDRARAGDRPLGGGRHWCCGGWSTPSNARRRAGGPTTSRRCSGSTAPARWSSRPPRTLSCRAGDDASTTRSARAKAVGFGLSLTSEPGEAATAQLPSRSQRAGPRRRRARRDPRLGRSGRARGRGVDRCRLLQRPRADRGDVPRDRRPAPRGARRLGDPTRGRHHHPARARLGLHQHGRREGLARRGRGGAEGAPRRRRRARRRRPRRRVGRVGRGGGRPGAPVPRPTRTPSANG